MLFQLGFYLLALLLLAKPLGEFFARVLSGERHFLSPALGWLADAGIVLGLVAVIAVYADATGGAMMRLSVVSAWSTAPTTALAAVALLLGLACYLTALFMPVRGRNSAR